MSTKVAIIASNGGLFDAYKVFNIATAAAATDSEVAIFFTFEGLNLIHKQGYRQLPLPAGKENFIEGFKKSQRTVHSRAGSYGARHGGQNHRLPNDHGCDEHEERRFH